MRSLHLPAALPGFATGVRLAFPAAVLGAVFGEWFGADSGLGPLLVTSMRNVRVPQLWATGLLVTGLSALAYGIGGVLESAAKARSR